MAKPSILVVDDEVKVTQVITAYLEREGYQTLVAHDGDTALEMVFEKEPDLVVLDLNLPKLKGEEVCRLIRQHSDVYIIMLTAKTDESSAITGLDVGADDYVTKPFSPRELMARIRAFMRRRNDKANVESEPLAFDEGQLIIHPLQHKVVVKGKSVELTAKEFAILSLLAQNVGTVFTRTQLTESLGQGGYEMTERTVDSHIKNIRAKIETDTGRPRYVKTVFGVGYKLESEFSN